MCNIRVLCPNILRCVWFNFRLSMRIYFTSYLTRIPSPTQRRGMTYVQRQQISLGNRDTFLAVYNQNSSGLKFQMACCHFSVCQRNDRILHPSVTMARMSWTPSGPGHFLPDMFLSVALRALLPDWSQHEFNYLSDLMSQSMRFFTNRSFWHCVYFGEYFL